MKNFGVIKNKMLKMMVDSYTNQKKNGIKNVLTTIKENNDFKEMYLLYEDIENKYFDDIDVAKLYVDELSTQLKTKYKNISELCENLGEKLSSITTESNSIYDNLDVLSENDTLLNIDKKVIAKKELIKHLTTKKTNDLSENVVYTQNENLLYAVLANNFNVLYNNTLNEEEKNELKEILSFSYDDLQTKTTELKENVVTDINKLISESNSTELAQKLNDVLNEVNKMEISKMNYYKLKQLKNGL